MGLQHEKESEGFGMLSTSNVRSLNNLQDNNSICDQGQEKMRKGLDLMDMSACILVACIFAWVRRAADWKRGRRSIRGHKHYAYCHRVFFFS
jgi:hypothetical protein